MPTGLFGKLPARGDFVARGLPPGARPMVDRWLTRVLAPLARCPDDWPATGFRGLIALGDAGLALLALASRDGAGRAFPLAAVTLSGSADQGQIDAWAQQALPPLRRAIAGDLDADGLFAHLAMLGADPGHAALRPPLIWTDGTAPQDPAALIQRMSRA